MIEFGDTLRKTREQKGLSTSQVAQTTHLLAQQIEALEREDFSKIAAPIYGRGFVKLYCEALGLDPKPFVEEFMAIYTGNKMRPIRRKMPTAQPIAPPPAAAQPVAAQPVAEAETPPPPPPPEVDVPAAPAAAAPAPTEPPTAATEVLDSSCFNFAKMDDTPPPQQQPQADFTLESEPVRMSPTYRQPLPSGHSSYKPSTKLDNFNGNVKRRNGGGVDIPPTVWRMLVLAVVGLILLWAIYAGMRALYRASMSSDASKAKPTPVEQQQPPTQPDAASGSARPENAVGASAKPRQAAAANKKNAETRPTRSNRKPMAIPPLYID